jgi:CDP-diacylglycerol--glycerol-3-phosphate 3-phosphatidyltransferase
VKNLRPLVTTVTKPLIDALAATSITPNQLSVVGLALAAGVGAVIAFGNQRLGAVLVLAASAFDLLDGALARATGRTSQFGAFLDSSFDRIAEALLLLGVATRAIRAEDRATPLLAFAAYVASVMVSYTRARAEGIGVKGEAGLFDRPARIVTLAAGLFTGWVKLALIVITIGASATVVQRLRYVRRQLEERGTL